MLGKIEGRRRTGWQRARGLDGITDSMGMSLSKLQEIRRTGKPGMLQSMGSQRVRHDLATEKQLLFVIAVHWQVYITPFKGFPCGSAGKESDHNAGDVGLVPGLGRSPGEGKGYPLQSSGLENSVDCIVLGIAKSQTPLSDFHFFQQLSTPICQGGCMPPPIPTPWHITGWSEEEGSEICQRNSQPKQVPVAPWNEFLKPSIQPTLLICQTQKG